MLRITINDKWWPIRVTGITVIKTLIIIFIILVYIFLPETKYIEQEGDVSVWVLCFNMNIPGGAETHIVRSDDLSGCCEPGHLPSSS